MTRRDFVALAGMAATARPAQAKVMGIETISRQPEFYHGWPTLAIRSNGEMLLGYSGGRETHVCPFGRVELMRSNDGGKSWSWPEVLMDTVIDDRDAGVCVTGAGTLLVSTFTSLAYEATLAKAQGWPPERLARWQAVNRRSTEAQRRSLLGTWLLRSTDGGMTWSAPFRVPLNSPHGPVAVSGGRVIYPGKQLWEKGTKVGVCESVDDGKSWKWLSDIPVRPGDRVEEYHELHAVEAADGRLIVQIRNHNEPNKNETLQCESSDGGKSWSVPRAIGVWGLPSHLLRLRDGRLLMSYGYRRAPFGNQARISADNGKSWTEAMVISDDGAGFDLGYPSTVELANGELRTVWYESMKDAPHSVLRMATWRLQA